MLHPLIFSIIRPLCMLCDAPTDTPVRLCQPCWQELPRNRISCMRCAEPLAHTPFSPSCQACKRLKPAFTAAWVPFLYHYPLDGLLQQFKRGGSLSLAYLLAELLVQEYLQKTDQKPHLSDIDLVLAVPTHWRRRLQRGVNPAALLADRISHRLNLPFRNGIVRKKYATPAQHTLSAQQRLHNLRGSFELRAADLKDKKILLIDDIMTTGATLNTLSQQIRSAGAHQITVWALARTPADRHATDNRG